jgi:putative flippase GtrA
MLVNKKIIFQNLWRFIASYRKIILFIGIGMLCSIIDIGLFIAFMSLSIQTIPAAILSFLLANIVNYYLSSLVFAREQKHSSRLIISFAAVVLAGLILTWVVMNLWLTYIGIYPLLGKLISGACVMIAGYFGRKLLVFRPIY